jgi:hypothetical protein
MTKLRIGPKGTLFSLVMGKKDMVFGKNQVIFGGFVY